jgi:hypothetical protein
MLTTSRRIFLLQLAATGTAAVAATPVPTGAPAGLVNEKDSTALALGYVADTNRADRKKFPNHVATQRCGVCALYQGKPGDASGPCPIFAGKLVMATGWCSSWVKKTA